MGDEVHRRLVWIRLFEETGDAGLVYRRCGISRPTLRKWLSRFNSDGEAGLVAQSRRPKHVSNQNLFRKERALILKLRRQNNLGARRIQTELRLHHEMDLSITAIHKVLKQANVAPLVKPRRIAKPKRYTAGRFRAIGFRWTQ